MTRIQQSIALSAVLLVPAALFAQSTTSTATREKPAPTASSSAAPTTTTAPAPSATQQRGAGQQGNGGRLYSRLGLTAEQKQKMDEINAKFRDDNAKLIASARDLHDKVMAAKKAGDDATAKALSDDNAKLRSQIRAAMAARDEKLRAVLTEDQQKIWDSTRGRRGKNAPGTAPGPQHSSPAKTS